MARQMVEIKRRGRRGRKVRLEGRCRSLKRWKTKSKKQRSDPERARPPIASCKHAQLTLVRRHSEPSLRDLDLLLISFGVLNIESYIDVLLNRRSSVGC